MERQEWRPEGQRVGKTGLLPEKAGSSRTQAHGQRHRQSESKQLVTASLGTLAL